MQGFPAGVGVRVLLAAGSTARVCALRGAGRIAAAMLALSCCAAGCHGGAATADNADGATQAGDAADGAPSPDSSPDGTGDSIIANDASGSDGAGGDTLPSDAVLPDAGAGDSASADVVAGPDGHPLPPFDAVVDNPPTVAFVSPPDGTWVVMGTPVTLTVHVTDDLTPLANMAFDATLTTGPVFMTSDFAVDAAGDVSFVVDGLPAGDVGVVFSALDGQNSPVSVTRLLHVDVPPDAPQVSITPNPPKSGDALHAVVLPASVQPNSPYGSVTFVYEWWLNGVKTAYTADTIPAGIIVAYDLWLVRVWATDGLSQGPVGIAVVQVPNTPPTPPVLVVTPPDPTLVSVLSCTMAVAATDVDGQQLGYEYAWTRNGQAWPEAGVAWQVALGSDASGVWQPLLAVAKGDSIACSVVVGDGFAVLAPVSATPVTLAAFDACASGESGCDPLATCTPGDITPTCACPTGYGGDGTSCYDINECLSGVASCDLAAACSNTEGSYMCVCKPGYAGDGSSCADVDECALKTSACDPAAECSNTVGSYTCTCPVGYGGDGFLCVEIDECATGTAGCDPHATCLNLPGSVTCSCDTGWVGSGLQCVDLNECASPTSCAQDATCTNFDGGFDCTCNGGFQGDGFTACGDVDECTNGTAVCDTNATCQNTDGSYMCGCNTGYVGDGKLCDDVDECALGTDNCAPAAICKNTPGSWTCKCQPGYSGSGQVCTPNP